MSPWLIWTKWISSCRRGRRRVPNPVGRPLPDTEPRLDPARHVASGRPLLLAVGRLSPQKGFDTLIAAFGRIASALPDWQLVIIGEGGERAALQAQVERLGLSESIRLPGHAGNPALRGYHPELPRFQQALCFALKELAQKIVSDGEGITRVIEVAVTGAASGLDARRLETLCRCHAHGATPSTLRPIVSGRPSAMFAD